MSIHNKIRISKALYELGGKAKLFEIYDKVEELYPEIINNYSSRESYQASIRATLEDFSSDSERFKEKEDLFFIVLNKGDGVWGVREYSESWSLSATLLEETERKVLSNYRITQAKFRNKLLKHFNYTCPFTEISLLPLLIASHIKPWHQDEHNRNNINNGILLSVHLDKFFDSGLISINENGFLIYKTDEIRGVLSGSFILKNKILKNEFLTEERKDFLEWHRKINHIPERNIFK